MAPVGKWLALKCHTLDSNTAHATRSASGNAEDSSSPMENISPMLILNGFVFASSV